MKRAQRNIIDLIIELETVNQKLDRIKNDPDYIRDKVDSIPWKKHDYTSDLSNIINSYL